VIRGTVSRVRIKVEVKVEVTVPSGILTYSMIVLVSVTIRSERIVLVVVVVTVTGEHTAERLHSCVHSVRQKSMNSELLQPGVQSAMQSSHESRGNIL
jgi:hypothetical protein